MRGSCPGPSPANARYGGNTAAVTVASGDGQVLLLDLGTGVRTVPMPAGRPFRGTALVTHLHFDHVQGLPFFPPLLEPGTSLDVVAPEQEAGDLAGAFAGFIRPPYFPLALDDLPGTVRFRPVQRDVFQVGPATVTVRPVPHLGPTVGYRIDCDGSSLAYVSDHQAPATLDDVPAPVLELCDGVDLLIHDAQYTAEEFAGKGRWGHSTVGYAVRVATAAGARRLCLFHHDPDHDDDLLDEMAEHARRRAGPSLEVTAASEGLVVELASRSRPEGGH